MFQLGVRPPDLFFSYGLLGLNTDLTQCVIGNHKCSCQMVSNSVEQFKPERCTIVSDIQANHARGKCVAIVGIVCSGSDST